MDNPKLGLLSKTLKENKVSLTTVRAGIYELLEGREPQSMNELLRRGNRQFDKASLYRTINLFEQIGVITRVNFGFKYKVELTDRFSHHHHHLNCLSCGRVISVAENDKLEGIIKELAKGSGFKPTAHQFEIQGYCNKCSRESSSKKS